MRWLPVLLLLSGCELFELLEDDRDPRNCEERTAYYADADGDGRADVPGAIFLGCSKPDGYVTTPPGLGDDTDTETDTDAGDDTDVGDVTETDTDADDTDTETDTDGDDTDTDGPDTDADDTDASDTDPDDSEPADTDAP